MNKVNNRHKTFYSTAEAAQLLKVSRVAVFKKIKAGELKADKVGRAYIIKKQDLFDYIQFPSVLTELKKEKIKNVVDRTVNEYGETLKLLGQE